MRKLALAPAAVAALSITAPAQAATLVTDGLHLTGATGVNVNGTLYNVTFVDGTCAALFSGCDSTADFAFSNGVDATAAAQALLDQVFIDGPAGLFDTAPFLTNGCIDPGICQAWIPYTVSGTTVSLRTAVNTSGGGDQLGSDTGAAASDTTPLPYAVWARFTLSAPGGVPEPATWAMMLLGFAGTGLAMRRQRAAQHSDPGPRTDQISLRRDGS